MDDFRDAEMKPGPGVESDDEIVEWVRATAETAFHPVGTCKMRHDPMAVVDDQLRVHGRDAASSAQINGLSYLFVSPGRQSHSKSPLPG